MKKQLLIITVILFIPTVVSARPANPALLPKSAPLRPPLENVLPSYSNTINTVQEQGSGSGVKDEKIKEQGTEEGNSESLKEIASDEKQNNLPKTSRAPFIIVFILVFLSVLGIIYYFFMKRAAGKDNGGN
ncbi:MAG: FeoB-associated Cys-rich membrane protein [Candidatus Doudnabacteria bacterium]|nr:FeoB-associated Cys-rich membrane protein [Candidatus Doudnabacteria bacterium]